MRVTRRLLVAAMCVWSVAVAPAWADHRTDRRDCSSFLTQAGAQEYFAQHPGDPDKLDPDDDGVACEELPAGVRSPNVPAAAGSEGTSTTVGATTTTTRLVRTGSDEGPSMAMAALLIGTGGAFVAIGRRRVPA